MTQATTLPAAAAALLSEGRRLFDAGLLPDAIELLVRARESAPSDLTCARWLAAAQLEQGAVDDASATLADARVLAPASTELMTMQAEIALANGSLLAAEATMDAAIERVGPDAALLAQRGRVHLFAGEYRQSMDCLRRSLKLDPHNLATQSALIYAAGYDPSMTTARLKALQRTWGAPQSPATAPLEPEAATARRLRIGYVSCAFSSHAAAQVFGGVLLRHDPAKVEVFCYSSRRRRDWLSVRLRFAVAHWHCIAGLDDVAAANLIRGDRIDILVDLDGHSPRNRLGIFSLRAAPVQVSAWGYVAGPGTPGIDYLLTDRVIAPPEEEESFPERIVVLPCAQPYDPELKTRSAPAIAVAHPQAAPIRFGCFNRFDKLNPDALAAWAEILVACPGSTLTLKDRYFHDAPVRERVLAVLAKGGVAAGRVAFEANEAHTHYLAAYDRIDLALDPFPVTGGVTTLDGLSQGVPLVTLRGDAPPSRIGASILTHLGLETCIADTREAYVRLAIEIGRDRGVLSALKGDLLGALKRFDDHGLIAFTRDVEAAYQELWEQGVRSNDAH